MSNLLTPAYYGYLIRILIHHVSLRYTNRNETRLDVLFNSAGVMAAPMEFLSAHGHDIQFGTNVLGHFYITQLLLPILISSAKSSSDQHVRVVNVSSNGHWSAPPPNKGGPILYDTLVEGPARKKSGSQTMYFQSKAVCTLARKERIAIPTVLLSFHAMNRATCFSRTRSPGSTGLKESFPLL